MVAAMKKTKHKTHTHREKHTNIHTTYNYEPKNGMS